MIMPRLIYEPGAIEERYRQNFGATVEYVSITAADGAVMYGLWVIPEKSNGESVILLHGIGDAGKGMSGFADMFLARGYAVLLPDSRAHGNSGGEVATYGVLERDDVRRWVELMRQREPGCTYLMGESMGAAIGLQAPAVTPQLCAVAVESPFAEFRATGYERMGWITHTGPLFWKTLGRPVIEAAILWARVRYGVWLTDANPKDALEHSQVPALLIAGTADRNIPMHNAEELEKACGARCELWIVPGADHGGASSVAHEEFERRVVEWFAAHDQR
jgi:alpha-beta hydrolase superfamily lysophospholipase